MVIKLRKVLLKDEALFKEQFVLFKNEGHQFAHKYSPKSSFSDYLNYLYDCEIGKNLRATDVPWTFLLAVNERGEIVGRSSIRHELHDFLEKIGGHVGYGVLKEHRGKGYGRKILSLTMNYIKENIHLKNILVTCDETNLASRKIIEANGGIYENTYFGPEIKIPKLRYWISL